MSKRKLTKQQADRIANRLDKRLKATDELESQGSLGPAQPGLVIARHGRNVEIEAENGQLYNCHFRQHLSLVAGDLVMWQSDPHEAGVVTAMQPRTSVIERPTFDGTIKPLAANVSLMAIILAIQPAPSLELIDRYLVAAHQLDLSAIIVLNKSELITESADCPFEEILSLYDSLGYPVLKTSAHNNDGLNDLITHLNNNTSIFVGQSGVGKSSIIQALLPHESLWIQSISAVGVGRHTTSTARLYHLPSGGDLIDSPGVRQFKLWKASPSDIFKGFREFKPYEGQCQFRNCTHTHEPECALQQAVQAGEIDEIRLDNYLQIIQNPGSN